MQVQGTKAPNRLRELRVSRGLKLYDIAAEIRADPSTVYRWEAQRSAVPDEAKLTLAKFYGVTVAHLMGWDDEPVAA